MTPADHAIFPCDVKGMIWNDFLWKYCIGLRVYLGNDPLDTIPEGRKKQFKLIIAHYTVKYLFYSFIWYLIYLILKCYGFTEIFNFQKYM